MVILWEAQVSPLGLHSKRWLAHHNEFLPETKPKQVSKSPKNQAMCNVVRRRPKRDAPHGLGYRGCVRGTRLLYISPWVSPTPQQPMLSMFTSILAEQLQRFTEHLETWLLEGVGEVKVHGLKISPCTSEGGIHYNSGGVSALCSKENLPPLRHPRGGCDRTFRSRVSAPTEVDAVASTPLWVVYVPLGSRSPWVGGGCLGRRTLGSRYASLWLT